MLSIWLLLITNVNLAIACIECCICIAYKSSVSNQVCRVCREVCRVCRIRFVTAWSYIETCVMSALEPFYFLWLFFYFIAVFAIKTRDRFIIICIEMFPGHYEGACCSIIYSGQHDEETFVKCLVFLCCTCEWRWSITVRSGSWITWLYE